MIELTAWLSKDHLGNQQQNVYGQTEEKEETQSMSWQSISFQGSRTRIIKRWYLPHISHRREEKKFASDIQQEDV